MRQRTPLVLSITALVVAVLGATPLGHAAGQLVAGAPPFAKTAGYAKFAGDSSKLNGRRSTPSGAPGTIPVVGKDGKLPATIGAVGPQGPEGAKGATGSNGATNVVVRTTNASAASNQVTGTASCSAGERAVGGGYYAGGNGGTFTIYYSQPVPQTAGATPTGWEASIYVPGGTSTVLSVYVVCASP